MNYKEENQNFFSRWNITPDQQQKDEFTKFRNRILFVIDNRLGKYFLQNPSVGRKLVLVVGSHLPVKSTIPGPLSLGLMFDGIKGLEEKSFKDNDVYALIDNEKDEFNLIYIIQALFWVLKEFDNPNINVLANEIKIIIGVSNITGFDLAITGNDVIIYPAGVDLLDKELINRPLKWLEKYPDVSKHFEQALIIYSEKDIGKYRNLLDNLRFTIEQLFKIILQNNAPLEKQKEAILKWLKTKGIHQKLIQMYNTLITHFTDYQNDAVKHNENSSQQEIEFMIYLTGNFIRLILELDSTDNL